MRFLNYDEVDTSLVNRLHVTCLYMVVKPCKYEYVFSMLRGSIFLFYLRRHMTSLFSVGQYYFKPNLRIVLAKSISSFCKQKEVYTTLVSRSQELYLKLRNTNFQV